MKKRITALVLVLVLAISLMPQMVFADLQTSYGGQVNVMIQSQTPDTFLNVDHGGSYTSALSARIWNYITADGKTKGPAFCVNHNSGYPNGWITVDLTPYTANPKMTAAFSSGYPLVSLDSFVSAHPECAGLTEKEYGYASQIAVWATLGQIGVEGTSYTNGSETVLKPAESDKLRVFNAILAVLESAGAGSFGAVGIRIQAGTSEYGDTVDLGTTESLKSAAATGNSEIKEETIGGKQYFTREFSVICTAQPSGNAVTLTMSGAPSGTVFADLNNQVLSGNKITLAASGSEYSARFKICIPADSPAAEKTGSITISTTASMASCTFYMVNNSHAYEQNFIIADPSGSSGNAAGYLKWGESGVTIPDSASLRVLKTGEGGEALAGAKFELTGSGGYYASGTTGSDGSITWTGLPADQSYTVTEVEAPAGFSHVDPVSVMVTAGTTSYITVTDSTENRVRLHKSDAQNGFSLEGVTFRFEQIDGSFLTEGKTRSDGILEFTSDELPYGSYKVYETAPISGYEQDDTVTTIYWDGTKDVDLYFTNIRKVGFKILKVDAKSNEPLAAAFFNVYKDGELITSVRTNEVGIATVSGLSEGYYECVEQVSPAGYVLDQTRYGIHLNPYDPATEEDPVIRITNRKLPSLRIVKYDEQTMEPIPNTTFAVYKDSELLGNYVTGDTGEIFLYDAEPGVYLVKEIATDSSHVVNSTPQEIKLEAGVTETYNLVFLNLLKPGIRILKLDSQSLAPLANARFRVTQIGGTYSQEFTTGLSGEVVLPTLEPSSYLVEELSAPEHYLIDEAVRTIRIEAGGGDATFVFTDTKKPVLKILKVSTDLKTPLPGATFKIGKIEDGSRYLDRISGPDGYIIIEDLEPGVFSVQETSAAPGYVLDETEYHVELFPGQTSQIVISNAAKPDLRIIKRDALTGDFLEGAVFTVRRVDSATLTSEISNSSGEVFLEDYEPGVYEITEKSPPPNFLPARHATQLITLEPDSVGTVIFENYEKPNLTVKKVSSVTGDPLMGAKFSVVYRSNNTETGEINDLGTYYSGEDGTFTLTGLQDGWYQITELESVAGFSIRQPATQNIYLKGGESRTVIWENTPLSALVVYKYDSKTGVAISNAVFQIRYLSDTSGTGGTVIGTYKTGANGSFTVTGLKAGVYIAEELASDGTHVIDTAPQTAYISGRDQDVVELYFGNSPRGSLLIKKISAATHEPLSDVEFFVTTSDGTVVGDSNGRFVTDSAGTILIENQDPGTVLIVREVRAKSGYILDDTPLTATIKSGSTVTLEVRNNEKGSVVIEKRDKVTGDPLANAVFRVTTSTGELLADNEGLTSSNGLYTTNQEGQIILSKVSPSTLVITEVSAPANYSLSAESQTVAVNANDTQTVRFYDDPLAVLNIYKKDASTGKGLPNAVLYVRYSDGTVIGSNGGYFTTGADGIATVSGLKPGTTVLVSEERAPAGYIKSEKTESIVVKSGAANSVTVENEPTTCLVIHKYIEGTDYEGLAGAAFEVTDGNGGAVGPDAGIYYVDAWGEAVVTGLEPGTSLTVREIRAPSGFYLDSTPQKIEIKAGSVQDLYFWNQRLGEL